MALHTTNYFNTFIGVADDCPTAQAEVPALDPDKPSVAAMQFALLHEHPYAYTSDEVLFTVFALRSGIPKDEWPEARAAFFSKGQACLRASPLTKRYGFGVHCDGHGRVALVPSGTKAYEVLACDLRLKQVKAMRNKRV